MGCAPCIYYIYIWNSIYLIYPLRSSLMSMPRKSLGLLLRKWLSDGVIYIKKCDSQYIIYQKVTISNIWGYIYSHKSWYSKKPGFFEEDPYLCQHAWKNRVSEKRPTNLWVHAADGIYIHVVQYLFGVYGILRACLSITVFPFFSRN